MRSTQPLSQFVVRRFPERSVGAVSLAHKNPRPPTSACETGKVSFFRKKVRFESWIGVGNTVPAKPGAGREGESICEDKDLQRPTYKQARYRSMGFFARASA